ncbi:MAG: hypothetical protein ACRES9_07045, partial [Gammaproteobacteria bacterium]
TCAVAFLYGTALVAIVPQGNVHISYATHAWGAITGLLCAVILFRLDPKPPRKRYHWEAELDDRDDPVIGDLWRRPPPSKEQHLPPHDETKQENDEEDFDKPPRLH